MKRNTCAALSFLLVLAWLCASWHDAASQEKPKVKKAAKTAVKKAKK